jgi:hypothetical protein
MEYYNIRLENKNKYKTSYYTESLAKMISEYYSKDKFLSLELVKNSVESSTTPIELLRTLQKNIQDN